MKLTLLEYVQDIMSDLDSDEVNSIDDTVEALHVAQIVKSTFFAMMSNRNWPHLRRTIKTLNPITIDRPTLLRIAYDVK